MGRGAPRDECGTQQAQGLTSGELRRDSPPFPRSSAKYLIRNRSRVPSLAPKSFSVASPQHIAYPLK